MLPVKERHLVAVSDDKLATLTKSYTKQPRREGEPGHLQLNGLRSPSDGFTTSSSSGTQAAFTQPEAWELAFIDEVPAKKDRSNCCNLPCFPNTRDQSVDMPASRAPPFPTPATIDTPNKILAKWQPVYPQRTEGLKGWYEQDARDARAKTWHGDTAQRPSTYRKPRETLPPVDEVEPPSPGSKVPKKPSRSPEQKKPPIPPRAEARPKTSRQQLEPPTESSGLRGLRKQSQLDVFTGQENVAPDGKLLDTVAKKPTTAVATLVPYDDSAPTQPIAHRPSPEPKEPQGTVKKPLRVSINQPERKAREKALLQRGTKTGLEHPPTSQPRRIIRSLQGPPKIPEADYEKQSAVASQGTVSSNADLPSTWKLTLSTSSSLELAMDAASQETKRRESKLPESETILKQILTEQPQTTAAREEKNNDRIPLPSSKESIPPPKVQPTCKTFRDGNGPVSKEQDDCGIDDRDVLRGLNIAISAACDEEVDAWIRLKTGVRIRRFLADLKAFETLGDEHEPDPVRERARKRRADSRKLKAQIQQSKAARESRAQ
ncbi:uncharacterized protein LY79DRAFT_655050 [Colletotrichum navitas]|uniref:Uncharacterized protein n=1 Tax=Colletotrichum navitas TaxID=681940 RepID=A0AAD8QDL0_9PEZI|nr:uncharacterized protein LY79DRAFT_655050 [Colletotrichum navitas]KAK1600698.1 hypothetical protein LY79DRAFT_655050 [Colletotrichum navitas]